MQAERCIKELSLKIPALPRDSGSYLLVWFASVRFLAAVGRKITRPCLFLILFHLCVLACRLLFFGCCNAWQSGWIGNIGLLWRLWTRLNDGDGEARWMGGTEWRGLGKSLLSKWAILGPCSKEFGIVGVDNDAQKYYITLWYIVLLRFIYKSSLLA
jgi:hypothetical protein